MSPAPTPTPEILNTQEATWALLCMGAKLATIMETADKARRRNASQGHHCDYRKALDSIADVAKFTLEESRPIAKFYRNAEIVHERERDEALAQAGRLAGALELWEQWQEAQDAYIDTDRHADALKANELARDFYRAKDAALAAWKEGRA